MHEEAFFDGDGPLQMSVGGSRLEIDQRLFLILKILLLIILIGILAYGFIGPELGKTF